MRYFTRKDKQELSIIESFRNALSDFPPGRLHKSESPDFLLRVSPKETIGIELTRLKPLDGIRNKHQTGSNEITRESLERTIALKEEKLPLYRQKRPNVIWLVITVEGIESRTSFNVDNKIQNWSIETAFNRVYLFDIQMYQVYIIK